MDTDRQDWTVRELYEYFSAGALLRNDEYQRGEAWDIHQKQAFVDSLLRAYPVPAIFLHLRTKRLPRGDSSTRYDIVDGQQRILALQGFIENKFKLLAVTDKKFRVPPTIRRQPASWAGCMYRDLTSSDRERLDVSRIAVYVVDSNVPEDEIRDLFIRLQSGTALTRQQVRDAWPGPIGPYVARLAGKLHQRPSMGLFRAIGRWGTASEDDEDQRDPYVADRQSCAQLLNIFLGRERDPSMVPSVSAKELDGMYHQNTDFDANGVAAQRFQQIIVGTQEVFEAASAAKSSRGGKKDKFRRLDVFAVAMYLQDVSRNRYHRLDSAALSELGRRLLQASLAPPAGKSTSGQKILEYYEEWREKVARGLGVRLDERRTFSEEHKEEIRRRAEGKCAICGEPVEPAEAEYDHFPVAHRDGGRTEVDNGRVVHRRCHPRPGRPSLYES